LFSCLTRAGLSSGRFTLIGLWCAALVWPAWPAGAQQQTPPPYGLAFNRGL